MTPCFVVRRSEKKTGLTGSLIHKSDVHRIQDLRIKLRDAGIHRRAHCTTHRRRRQDTSLYLFTSDHPIRLPYGLLSAACVCVCVYLCRYSP